MRPEVSINRQALSSGKVVNSRAPVSDLLFANIDFLARAFQRRTHQTDTATVYSPTAVSGAHHKCHVTDQLLLLLLP